MSNAGQSKAQQLPTGSWERIGYDSNLESLKAVVVHSALRKKGPGIVLRSAKGGRLEWLLDLRPLFLQAEVLGQLSGLFWKIYGDWQKIQIGAIETAAIPLLAALLIQCPGNRDKVHGFIVRKERKTTGLGNVVEGVISDDPIVLVDDILNSGTSAEKARLSLELRGRKLRELFVLVDFQSKAGMRWRQECGIKVTSLFSLGDLGLHLRDDPAPPTQRYQHLWSTSVDGGNPYFIVPKSTPLLVDGKIYRGSDAGTLHVFDANTGAVIWEYQTTGTSRDKGIWSTPAVHGGRVYFGAYNGNAYCLDAVDGREIWMKGYGEWVGSSPIVVPRHRLVYFGFECERPWAKGSIAALNSDTGDKIWEYQTRKYQHGSPVYFATGDMIIWGTADHEVVALDAPSGAIKWTFRTGRSVKSAPAIDESRGLVAFASFDKSIYVLDAMSGECRGSWKTADACYTTPLFVGSRLFCGSGDRQLYVIDLEVMEIAKKLDMRARVYSSPRLVNGRVVVGTSGGRVVEVDVESLEVHGVLQVPDAVTNAIAATPDGSRIFVSTYMNNLYAFERLGATKLATEGWARMYLETRNFQRIASGIGLSVLRAELDAHPEMWQLDLSRQRMIKVQRDTETIFLRRPPRRDGSTLPLEDVHETTRTRTSHLYPEIMRFIELFAAENQRSIGRAMLVKLKPGGRVHPHIDEGEYYSRRDRFHLVIASPEGSIMICDGERTLMNEGELWWFDNKKLHESHNASNVDRVHLIFDLSSEPSLDIPGLDERRKCHVNIDGAVPEEHCE